MDRKLTLDLDSLTVTSFDTDEASRDGGPDAATLACDPGCNTTRLTCSTKLC